ncbi:hypothetical protein PROFUN_01495 [Planoprotostelium fungivorum]|uniref:Sugar phosphate phosphatase n=1 Tax=Planoprotostelium fungivorum TaxID=1890364 RepID=A0A2P6NTD8_9EUKA|nr:hypothetical protein PROFUN_01495 [Planoprotostelium fungivorum]
MYSDLLSWTGTSPADDYISDDPPIFGPLLNQKSGKVVHFLRSQRGQSQKSEFKRSDGPGTFPYITVTQRWPSILRGVMADMKAAAQQESSEKAKEGEHIADQVELMLQEELLKDAPLRYFHGKTWMTAGWLWTECYMYRRIHHLLLISTHWMDFDPFFTKKTSNFEGNKEQILQLSNKITKAVDSNGDSRILFHEFASTCLWGNSHDLSLLATMTESEAARQKSSGNNLKEQERLIVVNHLDQSWLAIERTKKGRIDFVCDNAGFEQFVDLIFADWLVSSNHASEVHFHLKTYGWFVSDTTLPDFHWLLEHCRANEYNFPELTQLAERWKSYIEKGVWKVRTHPFWTTGYSYWSIQSEAPDLYDDLRSSSHIFFKGDLNFRKLTYDCKWPTTTPFVQAIGPLSQDFPPITVLRTNKADVIVGLTDKIQKAEYPENMQLFFSALALDNSRKLNH